MNRRSFLRAAFGVAVAVPVAATPCNYTWPFSRLVSYGAVDMEGLKTVVVFDYWAKGKVLAWRKYDPGILHDANGVREV